MATRYLYCGASTGLVARAIPGVGILFVVVANAFGGVPEFGGGDAGP